MPSFAEKASRYLDLGWPVFPTVGKIPLIEGGCHAASIDPEQILEWDSAFPDANIALATGKSSGITVVDIDGEEGERSLKRLASILKWRIPEGPEARTAKGRHLYFDEEVVGCSVGLLGKGIDVRGTGGACTLPPSIHEVGVIYTWVRTPEEVSLPRLPLSILRLLNQRDQWYLDPLRGMVKIGRPRYERKKNTPPDMDRLISTVLHASQGERNHTLNRAAFLAGKAVAAGAVSEVEAIDMLTNAALQIGLHRPEIRATVRSGIKAGEAT